MRTQCPYFDALFNHDNIEKATNVYEIEDGKLAASGVDVESFKRMILVLYTGQIQFCNLTHSEVGRLMACSNLYALQSLKEICAFELFQRVLIEDLGEHLDELMLITEMIDQKLYGIFQMMKDLRDNIK